MFTGIVEEIGVLKEIKRGIKSLQLKIQANIIMHNLLIGDSIAVNGVCLTVTKFSHNDFDVDVMPITFKDTTLANLKCGSMLNLERAMSANGRFGGHIVSGHVDGVGFIKNVNKQDNAIIYTITTVDEIIKYCISKGSIAVDGTSLTIIDVGINWFSIGLIPHTQCKSILGQKKVGCLVNLENDILVKQLFSIQEKSNNNSGISTSFLQKHGYL